MKLQNLVKGKITNPLRLVLYAENGIGKSTFASQAPSPIFLCAESGTEQLNVTRLPTPMNWDDILDSINELTTEKHDFKTLVLDTLDAAEPLLWSHICKRDKQESVESYGYGRGYTAALDGWRILLAALERLRREKQMHVVLLSHSWIRTFKSPEMSGDWDRHEMKLNAKASGLIREWADVVLYGALETVVARDDKTKRSKGVSTGARLIYTQRTATYDAKSRYSIPESMPLAWADFQAALEAHQPGNPEMLVEEILRKSKLIGGEIEAGAPASISRVSGDTVKLAYLNSWLNAQLLQKGISP